MTNGFEIKNEKTRSMPTIEGDINGDGKMDRIASSQVLQETPAGSLPSDPSHTSVYRLEINPSVFGSDGKSHSLSSASFMAPKFGTATQWFESREASVGSFYRDDLPIPFAIGQRVAVLDKNGHPDIFTVGSFVVGVDVVKETQKPHLVTDKKNHVMRYACDGNSKTVKHQESLTDLVWVVGKDGLLDMRRVLDKKSSPVTPAEKLLKPFFAQVQKDSAKRTPLINYQMAPMIAEGLKTSLEHWEAKAKNENPKLFSEIRSDKILWNQTLLAILKVAGLNPQDPSTQATLGVII